MPTKQPARIVTMAFLLWEYSNDDGRYYLVGYVDCLQHSVNDETGMGTDEEAATEFVRSGKVEHALQVVAL